LFVPSIVVGNLNSNFSSQYSNTFPYKTPVPAHPHGNIVPDECHITCDNLRVRYLLYEWEKERLTSGELLGAYSPTNVTIPDVNITRKTAAAIFCVNSDVAYIVAFRHSDLNILERSGLSDLPMDTNRTSISQIIGECP
jgi:hypothetical protein